MKKWKTNITIAFLLILLGEINSLYKETPVLKFQLIPEGQDINNQEVVFSPDANKIAAKYQNTTQNNTYMTIVNIQNNTNQTICKNSSKDFSYYRLMGYSYQSGPLTLRITQDQQYSVPQIWSVDCKVQYEWKDISTPYFQMSKNQQNGYIGFFEQQHFWILQYDLYSKKYIRQYNPGQDQVTASRFVYSQNHQFLAILFYNLTSKDHRFTGFDTTTGKQIFQINEKILPVKIIKNNSIILGMHMQLSDLYAFNRTGHSRLILTQQFYQHDDENQLFCTEQNLIVIKFYDEKTKSNILKIFNSDPQKGKWNQLIQSINLTIQEYGNISKYICQNNKLAVLNDKGMLGIFQYQKIQQPQDSSLIWYLIAGGAGAFIIIIASCCLYKRHKNKKQQQQRLMKQTLIEQQVQRQPSIIVRSSQQFQNYIKSRSRPKQQIKQQKIDTRSRKNQIYNKQEKQKIKRQSIILKEQKQIIGSDQAKALLINKKIQEIQRNVYNLDRESQQIRRQSYQKQNKRKNNEKKTQIDKNRDRDSYTESRYSSLTQQTVNVNNINQNIVKSNQNQ